MCNTARYRRRRISDFHGNAVIFGPISLSTRFLEVTFVSHWCSKNHYCTVVLLLSNDFERAERDGRRACFHYYIIFHKDNYDHFSEIQLNTLFFSNFHNLLFIVQ